MDQNEFILARVRELAERARQQDYLCHTGFLSYSEQVMIREKLPAVRRPDGNENILGTEALFYGGYEDAERRVVCFLPSYSDRDSFLEQEREKPSVMECLKVTALNENFAEELTHRDYLGALMNLGIGRDKTGDILIQGHCAYIFVLKEISAFICDELGRVKHTSVSCVTASNAECDFTREYEEMKAFVASNRLDAVLAAVFRISRGVAADLIKNEAASVNGRIETGGSRELKENDRVSVRGKGKFVYLGEERETKKGRRLIKINLFK